MNDEIRLTFPPMVEGQTDWKLYYPVEHPVGRRPWPWHHRMIWCALMWAHDKAERLWHWLWDLAFQFQEPPLITETHYLEVTDMQIIGAERGSETHT